jgi:uncharacterized protein (DUF305 family)
VRTAGDRGRIVVTALLAAALAAGPTGCSTAPAAPPVLQPGLPGEPNRVPSAQEVERAVAPEPPNDADVMFMRMMVPHHRQALDMSALVAEWAESPRVRGLAERITATQGGEIAVMEGWLGRHAGHAAHGGHHAHEGMPGTATAEQIAALTAARGAEFDRMYLELMIAHHGGAVTMATDVLTSGSALDVEQLATDVVTEQTVEISRMRRLLGA